MMGIVLFVKMGIKEVYIVRIKKVNTRQIVNSDIKMNQKIIIKGGFNKTERFIKNGLL